MSGELIQTEPISINAPAADELERSQLLANHLAKRLMIAEHNNVDRVTLDIDQARELCQLLHDSIRTAKQLQRVNR